MSRRFFIPPASILEDRVIIPNPEAHHITDVLRLGPGDRVTVFDGSGMEYEVMLDAAASGLVHGHVVDRRAAAPVRVRLTLIQGVPKGTKMDLVVRMGTELGVAEFVPALTARSVAGSAHRADRWRRIAVEAAKQSRRADVPLIHEPVPLADALDRVRRAALAVVLWEGGTAQTLGEVLREREPPADAVLVVGPEGGFERREIDGAIAAGAVPATLGPLILRTETAGIAAAAMLIYEFGLRRLSREPAQDSGRPPENEVG